MKSTDVLKEALKAEGIEIAEETAIAVAKAVFKAMPAFVLATENKYDDMLIPVLGVIEPKVIEILDNINKADNE